MSSTRGAALLALTLSLVGCSLFHPPTQVPAIEVTSLVPEQLGLDRQVFLLRLALDNPNDVKLRVAGARVRLDVEDVRAGVGELVEAVTLPARGRGTAALRLETDLVSQGPRFLAWLMSGDATLDYRVTGYVDLVGLGLGRVPVDERGRFPLRPPAAGTANEGTMAL